MKLIDHTSIVLTKDSNKRETLRDNRVYMHMLILGSSVRGVTKCLKRLTSTTLIRDSNAVEMQTRDHYNTRQTTTDGCISKVKKLYSK